MMLIDEHAIDQLGLVVNIAESIHIRKEGGNPQHFANAHCYLYLLSISQLICVAFGMTPFDGYKEKLIFRNWLPIFHRFFGF
jgi:hypothetical protein